MLMGTERLDQSPHMAALAGEAPASALLDEVHDERVHYALLIEPQQEVRVNCTLRSFGVRTCMPMVPRWTTRGVRRTKMRVFSPMMRGYILVHEDSVADLRAIRQPLPVHGFLRFGDCIACVSQREVNRLLNVEEELAKPKSVESIWSVGEHARVSDGPFWGINVEITDLADGQRIRVDVPLMGRKVPTFMDSSFLEKL